MFVNVLLADNKDSLQLWLKNNNQLDTNRILALKSLTYIALFEEGDIDNAISISNEAIEVAKKIPSDKYIAKMYSLHGYIQSNYTSDYEGSINSYYTALNYYEKLDDLNGISEVCTNLGITFYNYKQLSDAETYFKRAEKCAAKLNNAEDMALINFNLGSVYSFENKDSLAFYYFNKAREHYIKTNDELNLASADYELATIVVKDNKEISDKKRNEIIQVFLRVKEIFYKNEAFNYYLPCIITLGSELTKQGELVEANKYLLEAKKIAIDLNDYKLLVNTYEKLALNANLRENFKEEAEYLRLFVNGNDSLFRQGKVKAIADVQIKYETEKKEIENALLKQKNENQQLSINRQRMVSYFVFTALILVMSLAFFIFKGFQQKKKANFLLEEKSKIIEEKNKDITDSLNYAKRIQNAILPEENLLLKHYDSFIYYLPKDIVSGDFFWIKEVDNKLYFSVVDCTGHGVPGAFMSIIGFNSLNRIVEDFQIAETGLVLDKLNELVINSIRKQDKDGISVRDGMDLSICCLDLESNVVEFSGANNPLYILKATSNDSANIPISMTENGYNLLEIKGDKMAIGGAENSKNYQTHQVQLQKGDAIYLFSDGYADQFGGPKEKKFMYKRFKELILSIQENTMDIQKETLNKTMLDWKGDLDQIDDICVIGVKI